MKRVLVIVITFVFAVPFPALQAQQQGQEKTMQVQCRDMASTGNFLAPNETIMNGMACTPSPLPHSLPLHRIQPTSPLLLPPHPRLLLLRPLQSRLPQPARTRLKLSLTGQHPPRLPLNKRKPRPPLRLRPLRSLCSRMLQWSFRLH